MNRNFDEYEEYDEPVRRNYAPSRKSIVSTILGASIVVFVVALMIEAVLNLVGSAESGSVQLLKGVTEPIQITVIPAVMVIVLVAAFLEAFVRKERLLLDFLVCPATVLALMFFDKALWKLANVTTIKEAFNLGGWNMGFLLICLVLLVVSVVTNQSEEGESMGWLDTTPIYVTAGLLLLLFYYHNESLYYPKFLPVWSVWVLFLLGLLREIFRSPVLTLLGLVVGVVSAFAQNISIFSLGLLVTLLLATASPRLGWVTVTKRTPGITGVNIPLVGVPMIPVDAFIIQLFAYVFTSIILHGGNYVWFTIGG